ncbi:flagellar basal-body rod protein FlgG [Caldalkalibacillus uzonensis]|uniref:Flagellar basal-body rod protein FlgG n=1 Tax=Caldalkalibacillus uzonensis TaxID=353224 RepID=A0ABU0CSP0_9BACI|nr:flagellar hook-basal body protein [Caldalkalibacillus uzonensis]MDQ0339443.1 flagellar basal-body rod protein FlgG [Caldalkalibacillus uzonensis]
MNRIMLTSATSLRQLQLKVDTHAHNLSNLNTAGFKRREATFQDLLTQQIYNQPHPGQEAGRLTPYGVRIGHGVRISQTTLRPEQGGVLVTERPLDFMIEGPHAWFRLGHTAVGEAGVEAGEVVYTRDGHFQLAPHPELDGLVRVVAADGSPLLAADGGQITFPAHYDTIELREDGTLLAYPAQTPQESVEYNLAVAYIDRPDQLVAIGDNRFRWPGDAADIELINLVEQEPGGRTIRLRQGALETSNVDLAQEMTQVMATQRLMQLQARSISIADDMMGLANSIRA